MMSIRHALIALTLCAFAGSAAASEHATTPTPTAPGVVDRVESAVVGAVDSAREGVQTGATAAVRGAERGVQAASHGVQRGARAVGRFMEGVGRRVRELAG